MADSRGGEVARGAVSLLKAIQRDSIAFGAFVVLQGLVLCATLGGVVYNALVVIGMLMAAAVALDFIVRLVRQQKALLNALLFLLAVIVLAAVVVTVAAMVAIPEVRVKNFMLAASATAILNGLVNIVQAIRIERVGWIRAILVTLAVLCIGFGVAYWATYEGAPEMLTRANGIILVFIGATDIWLGARSGGLAAKHGQP